MNKFLSNFLILLVCIALLLGVFSIVKYINPDVSHNENDLIEKGEEFTSKKIQVRLDDDSFSVVMPLYVDEKCEVLMYYATTQARFQYGAFYSYYSSSDGVTFTKADNFAQDIKVMYTKQEDGTILKFERKDRWLIGPASWDKIFYDLFHDYKASQFTSTPTELKYVDVSEYMDCYKFNGTYFAKVENIPYMNIWVASIELDGGLYKNQNPEVWYVSKDGYLENISKIGLTIDKYFILVTNENNIIKDWYFAERNESTYYQTKKIETNGLYFPRNDFKFISSIKFSKSYDELLNIFLSYHNLDLIPGKDADVNYFPPLDSVKVDVSQLVKFYDEDNKVIDKNISLTITFVFDWAVNDIEETEIVFDISSISNLKINFAYYEGSDNYIKKLYHVTMKTVNDENFDVYHRVNESWGQWLIEDVNTFYNNGSLTFKLNDNCFVTLNFNYENFVKGIQNMYNFYFNQIDLSKDYDYNYVYFEEPVNLVDYGLCTVVNSQGEDITNTMSIMAYMKFINSTAC